MTALPPPVQPYRCRDKDCALPQGGRCARIATFPEPLLSCDQLLREGGASASAASTQESASPQAEASPPVEGITWSGRHLDWSGVQRMLCATPVHAIAVLGLTDAGKTCFLTSSFLQIANRQHDAFPYRFADSRTLHGWQSLALKASQWTGEPGAPIVPHTPKQSGGLLHLGLRPTEPADRRLFHLVLSDVPGEWVLDFAEVDRPESRQNLEFLFASQVALVLLDSAALLNNGDSTAVADTALVLQRLSAVHAKEPQSPLRMVLLVLTKRDLMPKDVQVPARSEERLQSHQWDRRLSAGLKEPLSALLRLRKQGVHTEVFCVSAFPTPLHQGQPVDVLLPLRSALGLLTTPAPVVRPSVSFREDAHPFLKVRRWEAMV